MMGFCHARWDRIASTAIILVYCVHCFFLSSNAFIWYVKGFHFSIMAFFYVLFLALFHRIKVNEFRFLIVFVSYAVFSVFMNNSQIKSFVTFFYIALICTTFRNVILDKRLMWMILLTNFFVWLAWIPASQSYWVSVFGTDAFNSNSVGVILFFTYSTMCVLGKKIKIRWYKKLISIISVLTAMGIWGTRARLSMLMFLLFVMLYFWIPNSVWSKRRILIITLIILGIAFLVPSLYLSMGENYLIRQIVYEYTGKYFLSGRDLIWKGIYNSFSSSSGNLWFGFGSNTALGMFHERADNLHSTYLQILWEFGLIGAILFCIFIFLWIKSALKASFDSDRQFLLGCIFTFWSVLLAAMGETMMVWGLMMPMCYFLIGLSLAEFRT